MANPFVGEIKIFGGNFAPLGHAFCNGQILPISQNTALFSLLGTFYGGNGTSNFALPNLQGSFPMGQGQGIGLTQRSVGELGGVASVTLTTNQMPSHSHVPQCSTTGGTSDDPTGNLWALPHSGKAHIAAYTANTSSPRRKSTAQQSAAVLDFEFYNCPAGDIPGQELTRRSARHEKNLPTGHRGESFAHPKLSHA
jgi:microcystin-dependent protein